MQMIKQSKSYAYLMSYEQIPHNAKVLAEVKISVWVITIMLVSRDVTRTIQHSL